MLLSSKFISYTLISRKLKSSSIARQLSSAPDNVSHNFYQYMPSKQVNKILDQVTKLKIRIDSDRDSINDNLKGAIQHKLKLIWTYNSNAIEGNGLTLGNTIFFLQHGLTV